MKASELGAHPHRRFNVLTREWVLVSPQRTERPWQGQVESVQDETRPSFDPGCYLCPGNARTGGTTNPNYCGTYVFDNDFPALKAETPSWEMKEGLLRASSEAGLCRVVCFSPRHDLTMARMSVAEIRAVVDTWVEEFCQLSSHARIQSVQIFENRGAMMGCSNQHPHGQIWANATVPNELAKELAAFSGYEQAHNSSLLGDYLKQELERKERIVVSNDHFIVLVPFWATWPFETLLISRRCISTMKELSDEERTGLAGILQQITIRYDGLFKTPFPYTMGFHQQPAGRDSRKFHLHAHFYPPLLRSATVKKFMVGYEMLAMPQRDISPETAAEWLRAVPGRHYLDNS
jgi:UDPglucose--hexose-1-phosphate uridylyltransferase